jgi:hypothetical protein
VTVHGIAHNPRRGDARRKCPRQHRLGQVPFSGEGERFGHPGLDPPSSVTRPHLRQIEGTVEKRGAVGGRVEQEHADLLVLTSAGRAAVLAGHAD